MSFSNLKRQSSSLSKITKAIEDANKKFARDEREWKCSTDKAGNGYAIFRFLPTSPTDGEESIPWVRLFSHGFKNTGGKWFIENCPTTLSQECPVCEYNTELWNTGEENNKKIVSLQKRKLIYHVNIYMIKDPEHPENNGKVFIYKFGQKVFDKIKLLMNPTIPDEAAVNPFDLWNGADFKLVVKKVGGFANYDDSKFDPPSALLGGDDAKLEAIWKQEFGLKDFIDPKNFKSYDEINARLQKVLGTVSKKEKATDERPKVKEEKTSTPIPDESDESDVDELMKSFQDMAE